jgi:hypothetical protein
MKKFILALALSFAISQQTDAHVDPNVQVSLRYSPSLQLQVPVTRDLQVHVEEEIFPEGSQEKKFQAALALLETVLNSSQFQMKVLSYVRENGSRGFANARLWKAGSPLSSEQVKQAIYGGDEKTIPQTPHEMNLNLMVRNCRAHQRVTPWCRTVVGSTTPHTSKWITLNWKFYSRFEVPEMVENIVHEWLHLIGFLHGEENLNEEVPYVVGAIAGEVARELMTRQP